MQGEEPQEGMLTQGVPDKERADDGVCLGLCLHVLGVLHPQLEQEGTRSFLPVAGNILRNRNFSRSGWVHHQINPLMVGPMAWASYRLAKHRKWTDTRCAVYSMRL